MAKLGHFSAKANAPDTVIKVLGSADNLDLHAHEIDGQVAPIQLGKTYGILLGGYDDFRLAFLGTIDGIEQFLLGKPVVIGKSLGINQICAHLNEAILKTLGLCNAAEGGNLFTLQKPNSLLFPGIKGIFKVPRCMNTLNDTRLAIMLLDPGN